VIHPVKFKEREDDVGLLEVDGALDRQEVEALDLEPIR
jgi:hypothetical protein